MTTYEQQALDFLNATGTTFKVEFKSFDKYFDDDVCPRNIFNITLKNSRHKFSFSFGSSLKDSLKNSNDVIYEKEFDFYYGLKFEGLKQEYLSYSAKIKIEDLKNAKNFNQCALLIDKRKAESVYNDFVKSNTSKYSRLNILSFNEWFENIVIKLTNKTTDFANKNWGEPIHADTIIPPTAYDVLASITKYDVGSFEDFCSEFGYDTDSRKAYKIYKAVLKEWKNVELLFTAEQLELLRLIN